MIIKGKIGVWFWFLLAGMNIALFAGFFLPGNDRSDQVVLVIVFLLVNILILPMVMKNDVEIDEEKLTLTLGFCKDSMEIRDITEVYKTHNPIASGALSLDRVMIKGKRQAMLISVRDKEQLFRELKRINPAIRIGRSGRS